MRFIVIIEKNSTDNVFKRPWYLNIENGSTTIWIFITTLNGSPMDSNHSHAHVYPEYLLSHCFKVPKHSSTVSFYIPHSTNNHTICVYNIMLNESIGFLMSWTNAYFM